MQYKVCSCSSYASLATKHNCDCLWENRSYRPFKGIEKRQFYIFRVL